ncbi:MAG: GTPase Era [Bacteroidia bacterium]|nr:GTPase Era [Bacteroidia bacterium]
MSKAGIITLVGFPNAGKSSLLNRLVQNKLAAISPKPQTTRHNIPGIITREDVQYIFIDTPGWVSKPKSAWHRALIHRSLSAMKDSDVQVWVLSLRQEVPVLPPEVEAILLKAQGLIGAFSHGDIISPQERHVQISTFQTQLHPYPFKAWIDVSFDQPTNTLLNAIADLLPESPFLYPVEELSYLPVRFFVEELLRETIYTHLREEVPYGTEVQVTAYKETPTRDIISATIYVERNSHKLIVIGSKGAMIKKLGIDARKKIQNLIGKPVYLELFVKVAPKWRHSSFYLRNLGYETF